MNGVLVITSDLKTKQLIKEALNKLKSQSIFYSQTKEQAKQLLLKQTFEFIIIDSTSLNDHYLEFVLNISKSTNSQILVLLKNDFYENIASRLEAQGIYTLARPFSPITLFNVLKMCSIALKNLHLMQKEVNKLQNQVTNMKVINQAKCILIQKFNISEDQAHHFIEKKAMDYQTKKIIIAKKIIDKYGG